MSDGKGTGVGILLAAGLAALVVIGMKSTRPPEGSAQISGRAVDQDGFAVAGVSVKLNMIEMDQTDDAGLYLVQVAPGTYEISYSKAGYMTVTY